MGHESTTTATWPPRWVTTGVTVVLIFIVMVNAASSASRAAPPLPADLIWSQSYDDKAGFDSGEAVVWHRGRVIVAGVEASEPAIRAYLDDDGTAAWSDLLDLGGQAMIERVSDLGAGRGRVFAAGRSAKPSGDNDFLVRAYSARTSEQLWQDQVDPGGSTDSASAIVARRSEVVAVGSVDRNTGLSGDWGVRAYDGSTGTLLWQSLHDEAGELDGAKDITIHRKMAIAAGSIGGANSADSWLIRSHDVKTGEMGWEARLESGGDSEPWALVAHRRWVFVGGEAEFSNGGIARLATGKDFTVIAYEAATGEFAWSDAFDLAGGFDSARAVTAHRGRVFAVGTAQPADPADPNDRSDAIIRAYDARTGDLLWSRMIEGRNSRFDDVAVDNDGVYAVGRLGVAIADDDWLVSGFDPITGDEIWREQFSLDGGIDRAHAVTTRRGSVYVTGVGRNEAGDSDVVTRAYRVQ